MLHNVFEQPGSRCRLEWGRDGARRGASRGDILVIVDTLSFATCVGTAVEYGGIIRPCTYDEHPADVARHVGGEVAVRREETPAKGRFSLSPTSYLNMEPGTVVVLASPNGATCSRYCSDVPYLFAGALINASAVGKKISEIIAGTDLSVTVVACGERWENPGEDGAMRVAVEDYLAAGGIIANIQGEKSAEAIICEETFRATRHSIEELLMNCGSGLELRERGFEGDVLYAARLDIYDSVPILLNGNFTKMI